MKLPLILLLNLICAFSIAQNNVLLNNFNVQTNNDNNILSPNQRVARQSRNNNPIIQVRGSRGNGFNNDINILDNNISNRNRQMQVQNLNVPQVNIQRNERNNISNVVSTNKVNEKQVKTTPKTTVKNISTPLNIQTTIKTLKTEQKIKTPK